MNIKLDETYKKDENYSLYIEYTAKPYKLPRKTKSLIRDDRGLYFIKSDNKQFTQQIWTQGETESSSCWFPTIDAPNQKTTQEILMTVDNKYVTLSNGLLISSTINDNGTRTDFWRQNKPHAPYLFMMAVGQFAIVKDVWRNKEISYYLDPAYKQYARAIFGKTPAMLDFFSEKFGVEYIWDKYSQIIVHDFVSGAMENTSATIFADFIQLTSRQLLDDNSSEEFISHELVHQWFGNLVTCESWANTTLNEAFATYGEYLWFEKEYGLNKANYHLYKTANKYLFDASYSQKNLIRFYYNHQDDMFDSHSYNKGACILHLLRNYVGDDAFFDAISLYLTNNSFKAAEAHDLRLAFEEITGEDLNWFFNQWFFASGHPKLNIHKHYDSQTKSAAISIEQTQNFDKTPLFKLPLTIDIYLKNKTITKNITLTKQKEKFSFTIQSKPLLININSNGTFLCEKDENKTTDEFITQFYRSSNFFDQYEAIDNLKDITDLPEVRKIFLQLLKHDFHFFRTLSIEHYNFFDWKKDTDFLLNLQLLAKHDKNSKVRQTAINKICKSKAHICVPLLKSIIQKDSSYLVINTILNELPKLNKTEGIKAAQKFENNPLFYNKILNIYAKYGDATKAKYFTKLYNYTDNHMKWGAILNYTKFAIRFDDDVIDNALNFFVKVAEVNEYWRLRKTAINSLNDIKTYYSKKLIELNKEIKLQSINLEDLSKIKKEIANTNNREQYVTLLIDKIINSETDTRIKVWFNKSKSR